MDTPVISIGNRYEKSDYGFVKMKFINVSRDGGRSTWLSSWSGARGWWKWITSGRKTRVWCNTFCREPRILTSFCAHFPRMRRNVTWILRSCPSGFGNSVFLPESMNDWINDCKTGASRASRSSATPWLPILGRKVSSLRLSNLSSRNEFICRVCSANMCFSILHFFLEWD